MPTSRRDNIKKIILILAVLVLVGCAYYEVTEPPPTNEAQQEAQPTATQADIQVDMVIVQTFSDRVWVDFFNHTEYRMVDFDFTFEYFDGNKWRRPEYAEFPLPG